MAKISLAPSNTDLEGIRAGDRNEIAVTLTSSSKAVDLTGCTITAQARETSIETTSAIDAVCTITNALAGKFTIRWPGDAVSDLLGGEATWKGVWDCQVDDGSGTDPVTITAGSFSADMDITR
jgi:hypothetical protein